MNKVLKKRILRDFKANFSRYMALILLIVMGMYILVGMIAGAETIIVQTDKHGIMNHVEDGQFSVFIPLTDEQMDILKQNDIQIEKHFSLDLVVEDGSKLRMFQNRELIDLLELDEGEIADELDEAVIEKRYAEEHSLVLGDEIIAGGVTFEIVGIGSVPDYDAPFENFSDTAVSSKNFGLLFVCEAQYESVKNNTKQNAEDYCYAYQINGNMTGDDLKELIKDFDFNYEDVTDPYYLETIREVTEKRDEIKDAIDDLYEGTNNLNDGIGELNYGLSDYTSVASLMLGEDNALTASAYAIYDGTTEPKEGSEALLEGMGELKEQSDELLDEVFKLELDNLTSFVKKSDNVRIAGAAGDVQMNKYAGLAVGVIMMILFTYVISVFVIHQIQKESSVIGALYALGVKKKDLIRHYITLPTVVAFIGGVIGAFIGFSPLGVNMQMQDSYAYFSLPEFDTIYPLYLILYSVVMPPVVSAIVNALVINKRLSRTALSLIKNEQKTARYSNVNLSKLGFIGRFQTRQTLRELRTTIAVMLCLLFSLMILLLGLDCAFLCSNIEKDTANDTSYEYMYTFKYPKSDLDVDGEKCYAETLSKEQYGYNLDITIMGIEASNPYYDVEVKKGKTNVIASKSIMERYHVKSGDKIILTDEANAMDYAFTIAGTCDYSAGLTVFMDIDSMRELFGQEEDFYNVILSGHKLDIEEGRLYATTSKADIERASGVFVDLMRGMVMMLIVVSAIIFCAVMYLMQNVMIERASFGISLVKIFGYKTKDVKKLYLNGNTFITAVAAIVLIPVAKISMDKVFPLFIPNVASGINLKFPPYMYLIIFVGIMLVYFVVNLLLVRKLNKITPAEVLKNRE